MTEDRIECDLVAAAIQTVPKDWGTEYWLVNEPDYCCKLLQLLPGAISSLHKHLKKRETFLVLVGECILEIDEQKDGGRYFHGKLSVGGRETIEPGELHRFAGDGDADCWILEVSTHHDDGDVVRVEESVRAEAIT